MPAAVTDEQIAVIRHAASHSHWPKQLTSVNAIDCGHCQHALSTCVFKLNFLTSVRVVCHSLHMARNATVE
jgi:bacterioferritin-associated ferredoxin